MASVPKRLEGKVAIITGGASGIGAATAKLFVQNGARVIVADIQDDLGQSLCQGLGTDDTISYVHCDVTSDSDMKNAVDTTVSKYGKLDIMYNNAGILGDITDLTILSSSKESFKKVLEVNILGAFLGAKHAARVMISEKRRVILFTASTATVVAGEAPHAYTMSKHALVGLMKNLCVELRQHGIRVNCISPGAVSTPILNNSLKMDKDKIMGPLLAKGMVPLDAVKSKGAVVLDAEEVAKAAVYLSSDESKSVSGLNFIVDGSDNGRSNMEFNSLLKDVMKLTSTN